MLGRPTRCGHTHGRTTGVRCLHATLLDARSPLGAPVLCGNCARTVDHRGRVARRHFPFHVCLCLICHDSRMKVKRLVLFSITRVVMRHALIVWLIAFTLAQAQQPACDVCRCHPDVSSPSLQIDCSSRGITSIQVRATPSPYGPSECAQSSELPCFLLFFGSNWILNT